MSPHIGENQAKLLQKWAPGQIKSYTEAVQPLVQPRKRSKPTKSRVIAAGKALKGLVKQGVIEDLGRNSKGQVAGYAKNTHLFRRPKEEPQ